MKKSFLSALGVALGALILAGNVSAHHGDADRYNDEVVTVTGTVVQVQFVNPHALIVFDVAEGGKNQRWQAELGGPQQLARQFGWTNRTLKVGDKITLTGRRAKSGAPYMNLTERANIVLADSKKELYRTQNYGEAPPPPGSGTSSAYQEPAAPAR
jgi:ribulose-5-phosphate 4-epimerase/fuculose-1-phosphate aldolase